MPLSLFPKDRYVGIDIGHSTITIAQVERSGSSCRIVALGVEPTPEGSVNSGVVTDATAVGTAIRHAMRSAHISANVANLAVSGGTVVVRTVKMPKMPEDALRKSIRFEAGRYVPSSVEDSYIECEMLGEREDGQMEVLVAASPKDMVESKIAAAGHAGLDVEVVDVEAFALYRALLEHDSQFDPETTVALVDCGAESTDVSVIDRGVFALTRSIPIGGNSLTTALESYFKLSPHEAEDGKRSLNLAPLTSGAPMENAPLRVIQPLIDELVREIRRSLNYYQSQNSDQPGGGKVERLVIVGGGSLLGGLPEYFGSKLGLEVSSPSFLENPKFHFDGTEPPMDPRALAIAVGLGMRRAGRQLAVA